MTTLFFINQPVGPSKISIRPAGSSKELHCPRPTFERSLTGSFSPPRRHQTASNGACERLSVKQVGENISLYIIHMKIHC